VAPIITGIIVHFRFHIRCIVMIMIIIIIYQTMVTANNYMFWPLTGHHQVVHRMKRGWGVVQITM
jgi:hypothetical protein